MVLIFPKSLYHTARRNSFRCYRNRSVKLRIGNVANLPYQNNDFDLVFAIQTHIFWEDLKQSFQEIYRVMSNPSTLIIASEKEKIKYHMTDYGTSHELRQLLTSIGFSKIEEKQITNGLCMLSLRVIRKFNKKLLNQI